MIALPDVLGDRALSDTQLKPLHLSELAKVKANKELPHNIVVKLLGDLCDSGDRYDTAEALIAERRYRHTVRDPARIR